MNCGPIIECASFRLMCERAEDEQLARLQSYWNAIVEDYRPSSGRYPR